MASVFNKLKKLSEEERGELKEKFADVSIVLTVQTICTRCVSPRAANCFADARRFVCHFVDCAVFRHPFLWLTCVL